MKQLIFLFILVLCLWSCESKKTCLACQGVGAVGQLGTCPICRGEKEISEERYDQFMHLLQNMPRSSAQTPGVQSGGVTCPMCSGSGVFSGYGMSAQCSSCNGTGRVSAAQAQQLIQGLQLIDSYTGGGGYDNTSIQYGGSSSSSESAAPQEIRCRSCRGTGGCQHCKGTGLLEYEGMYGMSGSIDDCVICHGTGKCNVCYGSGVIR